MRKRILIATLIVVGLLVVWWLLSQKPAILPSSAAATPDPQTLKQTSAPAAVSKGPPLPRPASRAPSQAASYEAAFRTPIKFYGKVIDQHGDPIPAADVRMAAVDKPWKRPSVYARKTDGNGLFSIEGIVGLDLSVEVSRPGYRIVPRSEGKPSSTGLFEYSVSEVSVRGPHWPDKDAPTIFILHKIGVVEPLVKLGEKNFRMARDGTPLTITVDEQGAHQVVLRCWNQELQRPAGQRQYDWKLEVSVPNGGLLARKDAFAFEAPQEGYAPSDTIEMPASLGNQWRSFAERSYFIRFGDGTFARTKLEMHPGGDHFVAWESFFNPKAGSPNLESPAADQSTAR
jgi:hypothetical protein